MDHQETSCFDQIPPWVYRLCGWYYQCTKVWEFLKGEPKRVVDVASQIISDERNQTCKSLQMTIEKRRVFDEQLAALPPETSSEDRSLATKRTMLKHFAGEHADVQKEVNHHYQRVLRHCHMRLDVELWIEFKQTHEQKFLSAAYLKLAESVRKEQTLLRLIHEQAEASHFVETPRLEALQLKLSKQVAVVDQNERACKALF